MHLTYTMPELPPQTSEFVHNLILDGVSPYVVDEQYLAFLGAHTPEQHEDDFLELLDEQIKGATEQYIGGVELVTAASYDQSLLYGNGQRLTQSHQKNLHPLVTVLDCAQKYLPGAETEFTANLVAAVGNSYDSEGFQQTLLRSQQAVAEDKDTTVWQSDFTHDMRSLTTDISYLLSKYETNISVIEAFEASDLMCDFASKRAQLYLDIRKIELSGGDPRAHELYAGVVQKLGYVTIAATRMTLNHGDYIPQVIPKVPTVISDLAKARDYAAKSIREKGIGILAAIPAVQHTAPQAAVFSELQQQTADAQETTFIEAIARNIGHMTPERIAAIEQLLAEGRGHRYSAWVHGALYMTAPVEDLPTIIAAHPSVAKAREIAGIGVQRLARHGMHKQAHDLAMLPLSAGWRPSSNELSTAAQNLLVLYAETGNEQYWAKSEWCFTENNWLEVDARTHMLRYAAAKRHGHDDRAAAALQALQPEDQTLGFIKRRDLDIIAQLLIDTGDIAAAETYAEQSFEIAQAEARKGHEPQRTPLLAVVHAYAQAGNYADAERMVQSHFIKPTQVPAAQVAVAIQVLAGERLPVNGSAVPRVDPIVDFIRRYEINAEGFAGE